MQTAGSPTNMRLSGRTVNKTIGPSPRSTNTMVRAAPLNFGVGRRKVLDLRSQ